MSCSCNEFSQVEVVAAALEVVERSLLCRYNFLAIDSRIPDEILSLRTPLRASLTMLDLTCAVNCVP